MVSLEESFEINPKQIGLILMSMEKNFGMPVFRSSEIFSHAIDEVEINIQAPRPLIFLSAISSLSLAAQAVIDVQAPTGQILPVSLMTLVVGDSGERKTAVANRFLEPFREAQREKKVIFDERNSQYKRDSEVWLARRKVVLRRSSKALCDSERNEWLRVLQEFDEQKPVPPANYKLIYEDSTSQALFGGLSNGYPYAGLFSSEGKEILNGRAFNDLPKQNSIWSGDPITVDRVTAESYTIEGARLVVSVMVQSGIFQKYLERRGDEARASGLWARFLVAYPNTTQGTREIHGVKQGWKYMPDFSARLKEIINEGFDIYDSGKSKKTLTFTRDAAIFWEGLYNEIEVGILSGGDYDSAPDHASKLMDNISRVAGLLCYFDSGGVEISNGYLQDAIELCLWCSEQFKSMFASKSQQENDADLLWMWLSGKFSDGLTKIAKSDIQRLAPKPIRLKERLDVALGFLSERRKVEVWRDLGVRFVGPGRKPTYRRRYDDSR